MNCIDYLKSLEPDTMVYFGSNSAYMWIGTVQEVIEKIPELNIQYRQKFKRTVMSIYSECKVLQSKIFDLDEEIYSFEDKISDLKVKLSEASNASDIESIEDEIDVLTNRIKKDNSSIEDYKTKLHSAEIHLDKARKKASEFVDIRKREIKDTYDRTFVEPLGKIVLVTGAESGDYWSFDEMAEKNAYDTED